ncbi:hypothetical protein, partial [Sphingosinicella sp.]|uniref:hypothetical protein n=1 Tax=Sphingosinicella sp. TaxID=1917971 RepID=UPI00403804A0
MSGLLAARLTRQTKASFTYDAGARLTRQTDWLRNGWDAAHDRQIAYNAAGQIASETVANKQGVDTWTSYVTNDYGAGGSYA